MTKAVDWVRVPGYPQYQVSSDGRVRRAIAGHASPEGRELALTFSDGYAYAHLTSAGESKRLSVHRLMARAFHGEPLPGQVARHLDGDRSHNDIGNLAWGTVAENAQDSIEHGTYRCAKAEMTHCPRGHALSGENLVVRKSSVTKSGLQRLCRTCDRASKRRYEDRKRAERMALS